MIGNTANLQHLPPPFDSIKANKIRSDSGDWCFDFQMEQSHRSMHQQPKYSQAPDLKYPKNDTCKCNACAAPFQNHVRRSRSI